MQMIPSPTVVRKMLSLSSREAEMINGWRQTIINILQKKDKRLLLIVGPCAIHRADSAIAYAKRLTYLQNELSEQFFIVMRAYVEKSRSQSGWKGFLYSHRDEEKKLSFTEGLLESRALFKKLLALQMPVGMEFLEPLAADYLADLVTWGSIGAKTALSPTHRELASRLPMPIGIKNSPDGSFEGAICGITSAQKPQSLFGINETGQLSQMQSQGNPHTHLVLRGGTFGSNYSEEHILQATTLLNHANVPDSILIDCSHGNSQKRYERQPLVFFEVLEGILTQKVPSVRGIMIESFLLPSTQDELLKNATSEEEKEQILYGASKVDGCLDWETTEQILRDAFLRIKRAKQEALQEALS